MKTRQSRSKTRYWLAAILVCSGLAAAQSSTMKRRAARNVVVSIPDHKLAVLENGQVLRVFTVSVGAPESPSPAGDFHIINRVTDPTYYHPGSVIPAGPDNPIGPRWIGLDQKGYGIHGTNEPYSIGKAASHGCIRLSNRDVKQFFELVRVGDSVHIAVERDAQVAQAFDEAVVRVADAQADDGSEYTDGQ